MATELTERLKALGAESHDAGVAARSGPPGHRRIASFEPRARAASPAWWSLTGRPDQSADEPVCVRGDEHVAHLVRIARELPEIPGEPPRLYVVTRKRADGAGRRRPNLEQAGLRGLVRVIGTEHPHLRATQIDVDDDHRRRAVGTATAERRRRRTRPPGGTASGTPRG